MQTFIALYRGRSIRTATLVAVSLDARVARMVADHLLHDAVESSGDPILNALAQGEARALRCIAQDTTSREAAPVVAERSGELQTEGSHA
jgi:hypothetical protein